MHPHLQLKIGFAEQVGANGLKERSGYTECVYMFALRQPMKWNVVFIQYFHSSQNKGAKVSKCYHPHNTPGELKSEIDKGLNLAAAHLQHGPYQEGEHPYLQEQRQTGKPFAAAVYK